MSDRDDSLSIGRALTVVVALAAMTAGLSLALWWAMDALAAPTAPDGRVIVGVLIAAAGVWLAWRIDRTVR